MRITRVEPIVLRLPEIELRADGTQDAFIVRIETDEGLFGIGEADTAPAVARAAVEMPASHMIARGARRAPDRPRPPRDRADLARPVREEHALRPSRRRPACDVRDRHRALRPRRWCRSSACSATAARLGAFRDRVPVYASALMPWTLDGVRELVLVLSRAGLPPRSSSAGPRLGRTRARGCRARPQRRARRAGPDLELMIDAGRVWTWKQALQMSRRLEEFDLSWLEEPLPVDDLDGYARLCEHSAAAHHLGRERDHHLRLPRVDRARAGLDIVQPDLARCGGFTQARRIASLTWERNVAMVPDAFSTGVLVAASLHMTAAMPHGTLTEFSVAEGPSCATCCSTRSGSSPMAPCWSRRVPGWASS